MTPLFVRPEKVAEAWPFVHDLIADALKRSGGYYLADDIKERCLAGHQQLWMVADDGKLMAVIVTAINETPRRKFCQIVVCTGRGRHDWQDYIGILERWAKENGCDAMKPIARKGWQRVLQPLGYRATHVVLEKDL